MNIFWMIVFLFQRKMGGLIWVSVLFNIRVFFTIYCNSLSGKFKKEKIEHIRDVKQNTHNDIDSFVLKNIAVLWCSIQNERVRWEKWLSSRIIVFPIKTFYIWIFNIYIIIWISKTLRLHTGLMHTPGNFHKSAFLMVLQRVYLFELHNDKGLWSESL